MAEHSVLFVAHLFLSLVVVQFNTPIPLQLNIEGDEGRRIAYIVDAPVIRKTLSLSSSIHPCGGGEAIS